MVKPSGRVEAYEIVYSDIVVREDISRLGTSDKRRIESAIRAKLAVGPDRFGKPLRRPHQEYWVLRIGNYRVVYIISRNIVRVAAILPRDWIYQELTKRLFRSVQ